MYNMDSEDPFQPETWADGGMELSTKEWRERYRALRKRFKKLEADNAKLRDECVQLSAVYNAAADALLKNTEPSESMKSTPLVRLAWDAVVRIGALKKQLSDTIDQLSVEQDNHDREAYLLDADKDELEAKLKQRANATEADDAL